VESARLIGTTDWTRLTAEFEVSEAEEVVVLICELRGAGGEVLFREDSLGLRRIGAEEARR
jgi:hypothetical protein